MIFAVFGTLIPIVAAYLALAPAPELSGLLWLLLGWIALVNLYFGATLQILYRVKN